MSTWPHPFWVLWFLVQTALLFYIAVILTWHTNPDEAKPPNKDSKPDERPSHREVP